jgi:hypothetical protein
VERASYLSVLAITILLLTSETGSMVAAGQGKNSYNERGGPSTHGGSKGTADNNAQWSADPEQGWVRSQQSHSRQDRHKSSTSPKSAGGKNKANGKERRRL